MASIVLLKKHGDHKPGDLISVPFHVGKDMVAKGVGRHASIPLPAPPPVVSVIAPPVPVAEKPKPDPKPEPKPAAKPATEPPQGKKPEGK